MLKKNLAFLFALLCFPGLLFAQGVLECSSRLIEPGSHEKAQINLGIHVLGLAPKAASLGTDRAYIRENFPCQEGVSCNDLGSGLNALNYNTNYVMSNYPSEFFDRGVSAIRCRYIDRHILELEPINASETYTPLAEISYDEDFNVIAYTAHAGVSVGSNFSINFKFKGQNDTLTRYKLKNSETSNAELLKKLTRNDAALQTEMDGGKRVPAAIVATFNDKRTVDLESINVSVVGPEPSCALNGSGVCFEGAAGESKQTVDVINGTEILTTAFRNMGKNPALLDAKVIVSAKVVRGNTLSSNEISLAAIYKNAAGEDEAYRIPGQEDLANIGDDAAATCNLELSRGAGSIVGGVQEIFLFDGETVAASGVDMEIVPVVNNASPVNSIPSKITWTPANVKTNAGIGLMSGLRLDSEYSVSAKVELPSGQNIDCTPAKFRLTKSQGLPVMLRKYSDCNLFKDLRTYYLADTTYSDGGGCTNGIPYPNQGAGACMYKGQTPYIGLLNTNKALDGSLVSARENNANKWYKEVLLVMRKVDTTQQSGALTIQEVLAVADLNSSPTLLSNSFSSTLFNIANGISLDNKVTYPDDTNIVFEIIAKNANSNNYVAGDLDPLSPRFNFIYGVDSTVPFVGLSCNTTIAPFAYPQTGEGFPATFTSTDVCRYSVPFTLGDYRSGKVELTTLFLTPNTAASTFNVDLQNTMAANPKTCNEDELSATAKANKVACWNVTYKAQEAEVQNWSQCYEKKCWTAMAGYSYSYACGYNTCTGYATEPVQVCQENYKPGCSVVETNKADECSPASNNFRFSGYFMQAMAALGCVAKYDGTGPGKYDLNGIGVAAVLKGQGIIPYSASSIKLGQGAQSSSTGSHGAQASVADTTAGMGGADPALWSSYPSNLRTEHGYACIPCQFEGISAGYSVGTLALDQDSLTNPRRPEYRFTKASQPRDCVTDTSVEVRYFGADACNDPNLDPASVQANFCTSGNLSRKSCPSSEGGAGGNIAGKFSIPLCAGSSYNTGAISASWSPLLIDVAGVGIEVSRQEKAAVWFNIEGKGYKSLIDWPVDTNSVAFLVVPNAKGQVNSIRELFGDDSAKNGFEKLKKFDSNSDGYISSKDRRFKNLKLWFDRNRNGISEKDELASLQDFGVTRISLKYHKPMGKGGVDAKTLASAYYNAQKKDYLDIIDAWFSSYGREAPKVAQRK